MSDKSPSVRGLGLQIGDQDHPWTLAMISAPVFFANSAEQFKAFLAARVPDPDLGGPNPDRVKSFNQANPNTIPHQEYLKTTAPCRCYASENYHSGHAYRFHIGGGQVFARILLEPDTGRVGLTAEQLSTFSDDFLYDTLATKLRIGPVDWAMKLVIAAEGDDVSDPTAPWSGTNKNILLGTLSIERLDDSQTGQDRVFDPSHLPVGIIEPEDDVFHLRSSAYAESVRRRAE